MDPNIYLELGPDVQERDPQYGTIVIPTMDPGRDKYGSQPESQRRIMLLTLMVSVSMADLVRREVVTETSRAVAIDHVMTRWNSSPTHQALLTALRKAKIKLQDDWVGVNLRSARQAFSQEERALLSAKGKLVYYGTVQMWNAIADGMVGLRVVGLGVLGHQDVRMLP
ncbi:hypothetical protein CF326_g8080 [Tilletia indica]|nr:hypothetical protein CF326_g8080 [Tilletia indica]